MWFVKPSNGTSGKLSATSSGSIRAMSTITRSGGSTPSVVTNRWPGRSPSSLPRRKRSTPTSRIVAMPTADHSIVRAEYKRGLELARSTPAGALQQARSNGALRPGEQADEREPDDHERKTGDLVLGRLRHDAGDRRGCGAERDEDDREAGDERQARGHDPAAGAAL